MMAPITCGAVTCVVAAPPQLASASRASSFLATRAGYARRERWQTALVVWGRPAPDVNESPNET